MCLWLHATFCLEDTLHISHKTLQYTCVNLILVTCLTFYLTSIGHYSHTIQMVEWPPHALSWQSTFRHCAYKSLYSIEFLEFSLPSYNWNVLWAHSCMFPANKMKHFSCITCFTDFFLFNDDTFLCVSKWFLIHLMGIDDFPCIENFFFQTEIFITPPWVWGDVIIF